MPAVELSQDKLAFHWAADKKDVLVALRERFTVEAQDQVVADGVPTVAQTGCFWARLAPGSQAAATS
jgi:hypothetical protein